MLNYLTLCILKALMVTTVMYAEPSYITTGVLITIIYVFMFQYQLHMREIQELQARLIYYENESRDWVNCTWTNPEFAFLNRTV
jgi:hypothetical protein